MKPRFFGGSFSGLHTNNDINLAARQDHDSFDYSWHADGCGRVHFYGINAEAQTEILTTETEEKAIDDWYNVIIEMRGKKNFHAIGITIFKARIERGREIPYKETLYINKYNSDVIVFRSDLINEGTDDETFLPTTTNHVAFSSLPRTLFKILRALNVSDK